MKLIIAGSRWPFEQQPYHEWGAALIQRALQESNFENIEEVVSGTAPGIDQIGIALAKNSNIPVKEFSAKWKEPDGTVNRYAGYERNEAMALYVKTMPLFDTEQTGGLLAVWNGSSPGTADMISRANKCGLRVHVLVIDQVPEITATGCVRPKEVYSKWKM